MSATGLAEFGHADGFAGGPDLFQHGKAGGLEFGDRDFVHGRKDSVGFDHGQSGERRCSVE